MKRFFIIMMSIILLTIHAPKSFAADDITGHYFESAIRTLVSKGIMDGYGDGVYMPDKAVTRAEFAALVIRALGEQSSETASTAETQLTDVVPGTWYYSAVNAAVSAGIVGGYPDNTFKPNREISRQEMAAMIMRAISTKNIYSEPAPLNFKDASQINPIYKDVIQRLLYLGVMSGNGDNTFGPKTSTTRGQMAAVLLRMVKLIGNEPVTTNSNYNLTLSEMIDKQMAVSPQTDKYRNDKAYVSGDYITDVFVENGKKYGYVSNTTSLNVREGASTDYRIVGKVLSIIEDPTKVELLNEIVNSKKEKWYEIKYGTWRNAKAEDVAAYVDPAKFSSSSKEYFQFLLLSKRAGATAAEINSKILSSAGVLTGKGQSFIDAAKKYEINEVYLVSHSLLETGNGTSTLAKGVTVESIVKRDVRGNPILDANGLPITTPVPKKTVYNVFGIGAYDRCPEECGAERAYNEGWFSVDAAILGGAKYISEDYINNPTYKQDTLYKMRWNPAKPGTHQYATDVGWAVKQVTRIHQMYQLLDSYTLYYDVPVYKK